MLLNWKFDVITVFKVFNGESKWSFDCLFNTLNKLIINCVKNAKQKSPNDNVNVNNSFFLINLYARYDLKAIKPVIRINMISNIIPYVSNQAGPKLVYTIYTDFSIFIFKLYAIFV